MTLRELRQQQGYSVKALASRLTVTERAIYNYEKGIRSMDVLTGYRYARILDVSLEEFVNAYLNTILILR